MPVDFIEAGLTALLVTSSALICVLQRRLCIAHREEQCLQRNAGKAINYSYRCLLSFVGDENLPKTIRTLREKTLCSPHMVTRQETELVCGCV